MCERELPMPAQLFRSHLRFGRLQWLLRKLEWELRNWTIVLERNVYVQSPVRLRDLRTERRRLRYELPVSRFSTVHRRQMRHSEAALRRVQLTRPKHGRLRRRLSVRGRG